MFNEPLVGPNLTTETKSQPTLPSGPEMQYQDCCRLFLWFVGLVRVPLSLL